MSDDLPPFPVDDVTLGAVEHALGAVMTRDRPEASDPNDQGPWVLGADYTLGQLLKFLAGAMGADPNKTIDPGRDETDLPPWEQGRLENAPIVYDTRVQYSQKNVIRALVAEIHRLRSLAPADQKEPQP